MSCGYNVYPIQHEVLKKVTTQTSPKPVHDLGARYVISDRRKGFRRSSVWGVELSREGGNLTR